MNIHRSIAAGLAAAVLLAAPAALAQTAPAEAAPADPLDAAIALLDTDPLAAFKAFEALAAAGDPEGKNGLAVMLERGIEGVPADPERARRLLREAAEEGSDGARLNLGVRMIMNGDAADDADAVAMLNRITHVGLKKVSSWPLGRAYLFGDGVEQDLERGSRLMMTAVEADPSNVDAQFLLGRAYENGWGIPRDMPKAFSHLKLAADGGDDRAMWPVGMMLLNGDGTGADPALARRYVAASAEAGRVEGMISMAVMMALGQGGAADPAGARGWYQKAADTGSAHALRGLAGMLMVGEGGPADPTTAAAYLDLAAKGGDENAPEMQRIFADQIAAQDAAKVEAVKAEWLRAHGAPH